MQFFQIAILGPQLAVQRCQRFYLLCLRLAIVFECSGLVFQIVVVLNEFLFFVRKISVYLIQFLDFFFQGVYLLVCISYLDHPVYRLRLEQKAFAVVLGLAHILVQPIGAVRSPSRRVKLLLPERVEIRF